MYQPCLVIECTHYAFKITNCYIINFFLLLYSESSARVKISNSMGPEQ